MRIHKMNSLQLLSLTMVLVLLAPAQQPLGPPQAAQPSPAATRINRSASVAAPAGILAQVATTLPGQSTALLPDGSSLTSGGTLLTNAVASARLGSSSLSASLRHARAWHTTTVLSDGRAFIFGGLDGQTLVAESEIYDSASKTFSPANASGLAPRAYHSSTLLTDGKVLIAGGLDANNQPLASLDIWDPKANAAERLPAQLTQARGGHTATLQADGTVRIEGGIGADGSPSTVVEIFDPATLTVTPIDFAPAPLADLRLAASVPKDGSQNVPIDSLIALRFSRALDVKLDSSAITIRGQSGPLSVQVVGAESGMLAFVNVAGGLQTGTTYTVSVVGAYDKNGFPLPPTEFSFSTKSTSDQAANSNAPANQEDPPVPPLQAGPGVTALSGFVRTVGGKYLPQVRLELNCGEEKGRRIQTTSDGTGRFLLVNTPSGHCKLEIDGTTVRRPPDVYGVFTPGVNITAGSTNVLPYTIWMTPLDTAHAVTIPAKTTSEVVVTNPDIPFLELHLPPNATVKDYDGNVVTQLSITRIPLARPPFPLPAGVAVPLYFTIQPGGAYIETANQGSGARLFYPNSGRAPAGYKFKFWNYDPDNKGWYVYGSGTVDANRRYIVPDPGTTIYQFTGAMVETRDKGCTSNCKQPPQCPPDCKKDDGDPVDPSSGAFRYDKTDFSIPDVLPLVLTRHYHQGDSVPHAFGIGTNHDYDAYLVGDTFPYTYVDLNLGDGGVVHFDRISPHTSPNFDYTDAVYKTTANTSFYGATIAWDNSGVKQWILTLKDGTVWRFLDGFGGTQPTQGAVLSMKDRYGNTVTMSRDTMTGSLLKVSSPNGRFIAFTYDSGNRVTRATDNSGRHYDYTYDVGGRLATVTDSINGVTQFTYDANNQMLTIVDPRNHTYLTNQYDTSGRVSQQTMADGGVWQFAYTQDGNGNIIQTDVTNPRGFVSRYNYNTNGYFSGGQLIGSTMALGYPEQQVTTYNRDSSGLLTSIVDAIGRTTTYSYDTKRNVLSVTDAFGTSDAATTSYTYDPTFSRVTSVTDPLMHTTTLAVDPANGNITSSTDPLGYQVTAAYNAAGQLQMISDISTASTHTYNLGLLETTSNLLGNTSRLVHDSIGRVIQRTDPVGGTTRFTFDPLDRVSQITDPAQAVTTFAYDPNGNRLSVTDERQNSISFSYDPLNRVATRTDALSNTESRTYDLNGNLATFTDRKGQLTTYTYDALDRVSEIRYQDQSATSFTYDAGNRVLQVVDSVSGTISRTYDNLDRLISETTPQGFISYAYDAASRRSSMTVAGQASVTYTYDIADKLTQIVQGSSGVTYGYDTARRVASVTLPNGIVRVHGYDGASRTTSLNYALGNAPLGNLTYTYDAAGRRTSIGGSLAATNLPQAVSSAAYNSNNQLTQWGAATISYDLNGNVVADGTNSLSWDVRNQLSSMNGVAFAYDAAGRRTKNAAGVNLLYDGVNAVQEITAGSVSANLLTGLGTDEIFVRSDANGARNVLVDALGSTLALSDTGGNIQTRFTYDPFGLTTSSGTPSTDTFQYTGRENDGTGFYYYRARYYSPTLQRFISEDPLDVRGTEMNLYSYVGGDPIDFIDPRGLFRYYGNWCGPSWTGGREEEYLPEHALLYAEPVDDLDKACLGHDICYYSCRKGYPCDKNARGQCMTTCDRALGQRALMVATQYNLSYAIWLEAWMRRNNMPQPGDNKPGCCQSLQK